MGIVFAGSSSAYLGSGNGDPFTGTITPSDFSGSASAGDLLILTAGGRYNTASGQSITVLAVWTSRGTLVQEDTPVGTTRQHLEVWAKIADASDISSGVDVTFSLGYGTSFTRSRAAVMHTYTGAVGVNIVAGPVTDGIADPVSPPESFTFPDPNPSGVTTVFAAGMARFTGGIIDDTEGFSQRSNLSPQGNYSLLFLDAAEVSGAVDMPSSLATAAIGAICFALRDHRSLGWKVGTL